ncbi:imitation switch two complex protein 1 [[Candida] anglica]
MVLYKRKQVNFIRPPKLPQDLNVEVWVIPETKEWFYTYEEYLSRLDYYKSRKFVCEITGNSCLTFFEALESEAREIKGVERDFPEALREHILRFLQFNRITRLDQLVDKVYSVFKNDYFPGETIFIKGSIANMATNTGPGSSSKQKGTIREKVQYNNPDGNPNVFQTKYLVVRLNDMRQAIVTQDKISRDRNHFTKWLIKTFIKLTMTRSHKVGAPWVVKDKYAKKYRIPQVYPEDLKHFEIFTPTGETVYENSEKPSPSPEDGKVSGNGTGGGKGKRSANGSNGKSQANGAKGSKKKTSGGSSASLKNLIEKDPAGTPPPVEASKKKKKTLSFPTHYLPEKVQRGPEEETNIASERSTPQVAAASSTQPTQKTIVDDFELKFDLQRTKPIPSKYLGQEHVEYWAEEQLDDEEGDEPQKEEEEVKEVKEEVKVEKVKVEIIDSDDEVDIIMEETETEPETTPAIEVINESEVKEESIGKEVLDNKITYPTFPIQQALECWVFLNVYHSVLKLDTFTFDDFVHAISWNHDQFNEIGRCELLDEIFCAVLSAVVSNEINKKSSSNHDNENENDDDIFGLLVTLPPRSIFDNLKPEKGDVKLNDDDEDGEHGSDTETEDKSTLQIDKQESDSESADDTDGKEDSEGDAENQNNADDEGKRKEGDDEEEEEEEVSDEHNAYTVMNYRNTVWHDRLRRRTFKDGNWQCIMMGVLSLVEYVPSYQETIEEVYRILAPADEPATPTTVLNQFYDQLDIKLRIMSLNIIISLLSGGSIVRRYIDDCLDASTSLRRDRLDNIRDCKACTEEINQQHTIIQEKLLESKKVEETESTEESKDDIKKKQPIVKLDYSVSEMTEEESDLSSKDETFKKLWEEKKESLIKLDNLKKSKKEIEKKLVEMDCQRVKLLGKDRFCNRYWWFENNGLPTLHGGSAGDDNDDDDEKNPQDDEDDIEKDEVLDETYLMGKLWIQGPSNEDLRSSLHSSIDEAKRFRDLVEANKKKVHNDDIDTMDGVVLDESDPEGYYEDVKKSEEYHEMDFTNLPIEFREAADELYGLKFTKKSILQKDGNNETLLIDHYGAIAMNSEWKKLTPVQRMLLEESPDPLLDGSDWRFYDKREDIQKIIDWLNPWGIRESVLRKELLAVKDAIGQSIDARRKALWLDDVPENEKEIEKNINDINTRLYSLEHPSEDKGKEVKEGSNDESVIGDEEAGSSSAEEEELRPRSRRSAHAAAVAAFKAQPRKRQKMSPEHTISHGTVDELNSLKEELSEKLQEKKKERELSRVLEWVNMRAREEFDRSLYEGGDRTRGSAKRQSKR